jgi:hypothetical protein
MPIDSGTQVSKNFALNEDEVLVSLIDCHIEGILETGGRFRGKLLAFNDKLLLLEGNNRQRLLIKRKMVARLLEVV